MEDATDWVFDNVMMFFPNLLGKVKTKRIRGLLFLPAMTLFMVQFAVLAVPMLLMIIVSTSIQIINDD